MINIRRGQDPPRDVLTNIANIRRGQNPPREVLTKGKVEPNVESEPCFQAA